MKDLASKIEKFYSDNIKEKLYKFADETVLHYSGSDGIIPSYTKASQESFTMSVGSPEVNFRSFKRKGFKSIWPSSVSSSQASKVKSIIKSLKVPKDIYITISSEAEANSQVWSTGNNSRYGGPEPLYARLERAVK